MSTTTGFAVFFLIWWLALFAVLPWGVRGQHESDGAAIVPGTDPGAPVLPALGRKLVWTTLVSVVIFAGCYWLYVTHAVTIERLMAPFENRK